jgi:hypothetical protein
MNSALHAPATSQTAVSMQGFYENIRKRSSRKRENLAQEVGAENNQTSFHFSDALEDDSVVLFSRQSNGHGGFENLFSVPTPGQQHLNSRSVVSHYGMDMENGVWKCPKDRIHDCIHIRNARDHLQKLIINEHSALGGGGLDEALAPGTAYFLRRQVLLPTRLMNIIILQLLPYEEVGKTRDQYLICQFCHQHGRLYQQIQYSMHARHPYPSHPPKFFSMRTQCADVGPCTIQAYPSQSNLAPYMACANRIQPISGCRFAHCHAKLGSVEVSAQRQETSVCSISMDVFY